MTPEDRVRAMAEFGFTPRQARFLVLVLRHSGVCLPRQYATLAGIVHGEKTRAFFRKLISRGYASACACRHNRAKLYHVHHAALYGAIHEPNSGYRRPVPAGQVAERLMLLDSILADPALNWLTSAAEKVAHFTAGDHPVPADALPRSSSRRPAARGDGTFPDRLPIGIADDGRAVFLYLVRPTAHDDFSAVLRRHSALVGALPSWTLRLVLPQTMAEAYTGLQAVIHDEWESPLHPRTVEELRWYFEQRRAAPNPSVLLSDDRSLRATDAFARPRFLTLYERWLKHGDRALEDASSTVLSDALAAGHGRVECLVLPHRYEHLSPVLASAPSSAPGAEKGAEKPDEGGDKASAPPRPSCAEAQTAAPGSLSSRPSSVETPATR